jgi:hypothetical protein
MDIANQFQKIGVFFANYRFVAILEEMAIAVVTTIKVNGITGQQTTHETRQLDFTATQQHVGMVGEQRPRVTVDTGFQQQPAESLQKLVVVIIIHEDRPAFDATNNDVLQKAGAVKASCAGHGDNAITTKSLNQERP